MLSSINEMVKDVKKLKDITGANILFFSIKTKRDYKLSPNGAPASRRS